MTFLLVTYSTGQRVHHKWRWILLLSILNPMLEDWEADGIFITPDYQFGVWQCGILSTFRRKRGIQRKLLNYLHINHKEFRKGPLCVKNRRMESHTASTKPVTFMCDFQRGTPQQPLWSSKCCVHPIFRPISDSETRLWKKYTIFFGESHIDWRRWSSIWGVNRRLAVD